MSSSAPRKVASVRVQSDRFGGLLGGIWQKAPMVGACDPEKGPHMALTDKAIKAAKPRDKDWKLADEKGLYLLVTPAGGRLWRLKFRHIGKEKKLSLGSYPEISLLQARHLRDEARAKLTMGQDPALERRKEKLKRQLAAGATFTAVATEYIDQKMVGDGKAEATITKARWFLEQLKPAIGHMALSDVDPQMMLAALKRLEAKGVLETAKKCRSFASRVFRYGVATGRCAADPTHLLQGALVAPKARHFAAILEPRKLGELLRAIDGFSGYPVTIAALRMAPHVFVRPGELRHAEWQEIDFTAKVWKIPPNKMKARRSHEVPLSSQVLQILGDVHSLTGHGKFVFPSAAGGSRPMSENTLNASFRRMGFGKDEITAHGLRSTASTLLNESGLWHPDAIERALAHGDSDRIRGTYHRGAHWQERVRMAQWWSDYLDQLRQMSEHRG